MKKPIRLTRTFCVTVKEPGKHGDLAGHGLMLAVGASGSKSWVQKLRLGDRWTLRGLGSYRLVSLTEARDKAYVNWQAARNGLLETHAARRRSETHRERTVPTFADAVARAGDRRRDSGKDRTLRQWHQRLDKHVLPTLGDMRVDDITVKDLVSVLEPLATRPIGQTLKRDIGEVMEWAVNADHVTTNPVNGKLDGLLPKAKHKTTHHKAMHHADVGPMLAAVRESGEWAGATLCLEFVAHTAVRSGEARGATWDEIDGAVWSIPADRMKAGIEHRVPLSSGALDVLRRARELTGPDGLIFESVRGREMRDMALSALLKGTSGSVHGLRSTFTDWAIENGYPREIAAPAIAHSIGLTAVERAYARTTNLEARRAMMQEWSDSLTGLDTVT